MDSRKQLIKCLFQRVRKGMNMTENKVNIVTVCWWDGYKEDFRATEVRFGSDLLWMRLEDGNNRSHSFKNGSLVWYFY